MRINRSSDSPNPTLIINRNDSKCGNCGAPVDPYEKGCYVQIGYPSTNGKPGCQIEWKYLTSHYTGESNKRAAIAIQPDLEWRDSFTGQAS